MWKYFSLKTSTDPTVLQALLAFKIKTNSPLLFTSLVIVIQTVIITGLLLYTVSVEKTCTGPLQRHGLSEEQDNLEVFKYSK